MFLRFFLDEVKFGGFLGIIVDFFLFDKEFVKLKFVKIKVVLLVERISRELNNKSIVKVKEYDIVLKREKVL